MASKHRIYRLHASIPSHSNSTLFSLQFFHLLHREFKPPKTRQTRSAGSVPRLQLHFYRPATFRVRRHQFTVYKLPEYIPETGSDQLTDHIWRSSLSPKPRSPTALLFPSEQP